MKVTWSGSVPPRGSGWVRSILAPQDQSPLGCAPTRYREVVLTRSKREFEDMGEFIHENIDEWLRHKKEAGRSEAKDEKTT